MQTRERVINGLEDVLACEELVDRSGVPIFMKESLREIMGEDFRQEFPWR